ncbi:LLM class flavin-dependent oxidoreductase [Paraburkholderia ferrariae]|uniref:LLM class flavin-dependent oxidoreductase n=1 Tax=Paraburkholderia ferrariae TaxID=386056 RepID=A0ABU9RPE7_9BURK
MNTASHLNYGLWRHPYDDETGRYTHVDHWTDLAKLLDEGGLDTLFIAYALRLLDVYGGSAETSLRTGAQLPVNDLGCRRHVRRWRNARRTVRKQRG